MTTASETVDAIQKDREFEYGELQQVRGVTSRVELLRLSVLILAAAVLLGYVPQSTTYLDRAEQQLQNWENGTHPHWLKQLRIEDLQSRSERERAELSSAIDALLSGVPSSAFPTTRVHAITEAIQGDGASFWRASEIVEWIVNSPAERRKYPNAGSLKTAGDFPGAGPNDPPYSFSREWYLLEPALKANDKTSVDDLSRALKPVIASYQSFIPSLRRLELTNWPSWTIEAFRGLKDEHGDAFARLTLAVETALPRDSAVPTSSSLLLGDYLKHAKRAISEEGAKLRETGTRSLTIWDLKIALSVEHILLIFPGLFLLSESLIRVLRAHARARAIRLAALEQRLGRELGERWGGVALGFECLNDRSTFDYVRSRDWQALFDNDPDFFIELFYSATSWTLAAYMALRASRVLNLTFHSTFFLIASSIAALSVLILSHLVANNLVRKVRRTAAS